MKDFSVINQNQVSNRDQVNNNNTITTNTENAYSENEIAVEIQNAADVDHNEVYDHLDKAANDSSEQETIHEKELYNTQESEPEAHENDTANELIHGDSSKVIEKNENEISVVNKDSTKYIDDFGPKETNNEKHYNTIKHEIQSKIEEDVNKTKPVALQEDTNTLENDTNDKDSLETVPEIFKEKVTRKILEQEICVITLLFL